LKSWGGCFGQRERRPPARVPAENDAALPPLLVE
jgi:hypothetical protein